MILKMINIREPAVAGSFYPEDPIELRRIVKSMLDEADVSPKIPKAMIVPHAGYIYSGPVAASGYALLANDKPPITRVVLVGPSHRVGFKGLAVSNADQFATPLGAIPLAQHAMERIKKLAYVHELDQAHALEHSLEVHLPFLQEVLDEFTLIPIVVGDAKPLEVCQVLELLWGGAETLIIISSDLSHYHPYETARRMDRETSDAIEALQWESISYDSACGRGAVNGLLVAARRRQLRVSTVDLRNSGDTAGSKDRVVGYGTYVFE